MSINFRAFLAKAKADIDTFEENVTKGIANILLSSTNIVDKFAKWIETASNDEPLVIADLESPIAKEVASMLPNGTAYLDEVITLLNRVAPYMKNAIGEAVVFDGAMHHLAAEITSILDGGKQSIDEYIDQIQQLFLPAPTA